MDLASIITIFLAMAAGTIFGQAVFGLFFRSHIDRRVAKANKNTLRHAQSYKRQTEKGVNEAVSKFENLGRFIDEKAEITAKRCIETLEAIRQDVVQMLKTASEKPADSNDKGNRPFRSPLFSIDEARNRAEKRLAAEIAEKAIQPSAKTGT